MMPSCNRLCSGMEGDKAANFHIRSTLRPRQQHVFQIVYLFTYLYTIYAHVLSYVIDMYGYD